MSRHTVTVDLRTPAESIQQPNTTAAVEWKLERHSSLTGKLCSLK